MAPRVKKRKPPPSAAGDHPSPQAPEGLVVPEPPKAPPKESAKARAEHYVEPLLRRIQSLISAIQNNDESQIEEAILRLSRSRRLFAPLAFAIGAFALLFDGLRLILSNWRLTLVQIIPAMWIWLALYDFKGHLLYGRTFHGLSGWVLVPICVAIIVLTIISFFFNAVFAMAISRPGRPEIRPAVADARRHLTPIVVTGLVIGAALAFATMFAPRLGRQWFTVSLGIVVGLMMVSYVSLPARLIGIKPHQPVREKLTTSAVGGIIGATVCTPPYLLGRLGILMLGSKVLFVPGLFVLTVGVTLQAGATGAVRAIKLSAKLTGRDHHRTDEGPARAAEDVTEA
jgi:hypothetical protein